MRSPLLIAVTVVTAVVLAGCFGGAASVPEDQALVPADPPEGWVEHELGGVTFSTPAQWDELDLPAPEQGTARVAYAGAPSPSGSTGGIVLMVIPEPSFSSKTQGQTFINNAQNSEQATDSALEEIAWPEATAASLATYTAQVGDDDPQPHPTTNLVLDFENGYQVQATVRAQEGTPEAEVLHQVLASIKAPADPALTDQA